MSLVLATTLGLALTQSVHASGFFQAKNLNDCIGYSSTDLMQAPQGTELPFAGIRVFRGDGQRGRSITYCLTTVWTGSPQCCSASELIKLPPWMRKDAESLRLAVAPGCSTRYDLYSPGLKHFLATARLRDFNASGPRKADRGIREPADDMAAKIDATLGCGFG
jgi:hypothetical protein